MLSGEGMMVKARSPARPAISKPAAWAVAKRIAKRVCEHCGEPFEPRKATYRFCSIVCWNRRLGAARMRPRPDDFEQVFLTIGRYLCEEHYGTHRRTITRWLEEIGKDDLIRRRREVVQSRRLGVDLTVKRQGGVGNG